MGKLEGKIAIVTGAARGMGAATARLFAREGAQVVLTDVLSEGEAVAAEIGSQALFVTHDVSDFAAWQAVDRLTRERFGPANVLVNNAGILRTGTVIDLDPADYELVLRINLTGTFLGMKTIAPGMIERGGGSIVNISSTEGLQGTNGMGAYASSKWGVRGLTKVAATELMHRGVRVNSLHPGPVDTPMGNPGGLGTAELNTMFEALPAQRAAHPDEIARVSLFLASDDSSFMCGAEVAVDGGMTLGEYLRFLPGLPESLQTKG